MYRRKCSRIFGPIGEPLRSGFAAILPRTALLLLLLLIPPHGSSSARVLQRQSPRTTEHCRKLVLAGEVSAGQQWSAPIGQGWVFRVVPIPPSGKSYSGWDLVVNRAEDDEYPDALLLATPPYGSLNEREIGTTFGLRAQDAIAWSPRRFHFLTSKRDLERARELFRAMMTAGGTKPGTSADAAVQTKTASDLLSLVTMAGDRGSRVAAGQFEVLDARLAAGVADPPAFAQQWAMHLDQIPHSVAELGQKPSARGELLWIRFAVTILLPEGWKTPAGTSSEEAKCAE